MKHLLSDEDLSSGSSVDKEKLIKIVQEIMRQIVYITKRTENSNLVEDEIYELTEELEMLRSNFEFLKDLLEGSIKEGEWGDFSFDGDYQGLFNEYLEQLYDLGDRRVLNKKNEIEKYIFIE